MTTKYINPPFRNLSPTGPLSIENLQPTNKSSVSLPDRFFCAASDMLFLPGRLEGDEDGVPTVAVASVDGLVMHMVLAEGVSHLIEK